MCVQLFDYRDRVADGENKSNSLDGLQQLPQTLTLCRWLPHQNLVFIWPFVTTITLATIILAQSPIGCSVEFINWAVSWYPRPRGLQQGPDSLWPTFYIKKGQKACVNDRSICLIDIASKLLENIRFLLFRMQEHVWPIVVLIEEHSVLIRSSFYIEFWEIAINSSNPLQCFIQLRAAFSSADR